MLKAPLTLIFPRLLLNSSNKGTNGSHAHHVRRDTGPDSSEQIKKKNFAFDSWGRPESNEDLIRIPSLKGGSSRTIPAGEDQFFGKNDGKDIPMGAITKTTDVSVCYDDHDSISSSDMPHMTIPAMIPSRHGGVRYV